MGKADIVIILILVIIIVVVCVKTKMVEGVVDDDIARRAPDPYLMLYYGNMKDQSLSSPRDYFLENQTYALQGLIKPPEGWDMYRPYYDYTPGYHLLGV